MYRLISVFAVFNAIRGDYVQPINSKPPNFDLSTLKFVSVIARHGSRSSYGSFTRDPYHPKITKYWPHGVAELTKVGRQQAFALGVRLRTRYRPFLDDVYDKNKVTIQSNLFSRGLLSAQLIAAGMFPPTDYQIWNESMPWQPIEVWPMNFDVSSAEEKCPTFIEWSKIRRNQVMASVSKDERVLIDELTNYTGYPPGFDIKGAYDPLKAERENGFQLPAWANDTLMDRLSHLTSRWWLAKTVGSAAQIRLSGGPHIAWLVGQLTRSEESTSEFSVFVGHDSTIVAVLYGLGILAEFIPDPASYVAVELHENATDSFVQILHFENSSVTRPTLLEMPECPHPCPIERFVDVGLRAVPQNWDLECYGSGTDNSVLSYFLLLAIFALRVSI